MKIPILGDQHDPAAIVGFEVEQMIMPKLHGIHVPHFVAAGDFTGQPYIVMELIAGQSLRARFDAAPLPIAEVVRDRHQGRQCAARPASAARDPPRPQAEQHHVPRQRRSGPDRLRPVAARPVAGPAGRGIPAADGHRPLHFAGAGAAYPQRPAQRPVRARRAAVPPRHRRPAARLSDHGARPAPPAVPRRGAAARAERRESRPGCRKSSCAAWKSIPTSGTKPPPNWRSNCRIRTRCN